MTSPGSPFREEDLSARILLLEEQRAVLVAELREHQHRPWSWARFCAGLLVGAVGATVLGIVALAMLLR